MSRHAGFMLLLFGIVFGGGALYVLAPDGDFPWQRWLGGTILTTHQIPRALGHETFTAVGAPWVPQEWLYGITAQVTWAHGGYGAFAVLIACCAMLALVLVERRARRRGIRGTALALCTGLAGIAMLESFGARAQVVAWPCLAAFLLALDEDGERVWWTIPLTALWSNVHASVVLAPIVAGLDLAGRVLGTRRMTQEVRTRALLAPCVALATCCNPFGWGLDRYAIELFRSPIPRAIQEWRPASVDDLSLIAGVLPLALCAAFAWRARLLPLRELPSAVMFLILAFTHVRNLPLCGIALAPLAGSWLMRRWPPAGEPAPPLTAHRRIPQTVMGALALFVIAAVLHARHVPPERAAPVRILAYLEGQQGTHRLLCEDFAWCSAAIGNPGVRVFIDSRCDPYPAVVWKDYLAIVDLAPPWRRNLEKWRVDAVIAKRGGRLARALDGLSGWKKIRIDDRYALYEGMAAPRAAVLDATEE